MKIEINNTRKIFRIQEEFNNVFLNLKIAFYQKPNTNRGISSHRLVKRNSKTLNYCRVTNNSGFITICSAMTIGELKNHFMDVYELTIDLFQRIGKNRWHSIPSSDGATIDQANKKTVIDKIY